MQSPMLLPKNLVSHFLVHEQVFDRFEISGVSRFDEGLIVSARRKLSENDVRMGQAAITKPNIITIAGIGPVSGRLDKARSNRIEMNVAGEVNQIGLLVHMLGFEGALKEWPHTVLLTVDGFGVRDAKRMHDFTAECVRLEVNEPVVMGRHQAIGYGVNQVGLTVTAHAFDKKAPVLFLEKDRLPVHASIVKMVVVPGEEFGFAHGLLFLIRSEPRFFPAQKLGYCF